MLNDDNSQLESAGTDSFLDVTTNIVGILIVLVIVIGMRVKHNPPPSQSPDPSSAELTAIQHSAAELEYEVRDAEEQVASVEQEIATRSVERQALAAMIAAAEKHVGDRRAELDASNQEQFDLRRQVDQERDLVGRQQGELNDLKSQPQTVEEVKHYPTPLSRTVQGHEVFYELRGKRITYVPVDEFMEDVRSNMRGALNVRELTENVGIVGPRNGFEFRYICGVTTDRDRGVVHVGTRQWEVTPTGIQTGETVEQALAEQSEFRRALALHSPQDTSVTIWTYPDSFAEYRKFKEELHRLGFATAGRPLPDGVLIGASYEGKKSAAQ